jgi:hypothetical protein
MAPGLYSGPNQSCASSEYPAKVGAAAITKRGSHLGQVAALTFEDRAVEDLKSQLFLEPVTYPIKRFDPVEGVVGAPSAVTMGPQRRAEKCGWRFAAVL